mmetsp:Transcript_11368/g.16945  ORF Transcript_11368/g.16945 Transcript_11368/m.16945 type:complete len:312 (-) Transcript_11368:1459-2394(-)
MENKAIGNGDRGAELTRSRRSIFPEYNTSLKSVNSLPTNANKRVHFSRVARVMTVKCLQDFSKTDKSLIWFQYSDYMRFQKTTQIIAKTAPKMEDDIWLASDCPKMEEPYHDTSDHQNKTSTNGDLKTKWWCMFGHSRRGLEQVVSKEEGLQRQRNMNTAIKAVLDEQSRQRVNRVNDPARLANVSLKYTAWARNLALAVAAADDDAVQADFNNEEKTRVYHWNKIMKRTSSSNSETTAQVCWDKGQVIIPFSIDICLGFLDANTNSTLQFQQQQLYGMRTKDFMSFLKEVSVERDLLLACDEHVNFTYSQ